MDSKEFDPIMVNPNLAFAPEGYEIHLEFRAKIYQSLFVNDNLSPPRRDPPRRILGIHLTVDNKTQYYNDMPDYNDLLEITNIWLVHCNKISQIDFTYGYWMGNNEEIIFDIAVEKVPEYKEFDFLEAVVEITFKNGHKELIGTLAKVRKTHF